MAEFVTLCPADDIPPGHREVFGVGDKWIAVFNVGGRFHAIEDLCTHDGNSLADGRLRGLKIECPRHGALFDIRTGEVQSPPAYEDIDYFVVRVQDGQILLSLEPGD